MSGDGESLQVVGALPEAVPEVHLPSIAAEPPRVACSMMTDINLQSRLGSILLVDIHPVTNKPI
jgi:hypothetical protein